MWQRWNQGTHIFEKSTDNGASWTPLGLNASVITEGSFAKAQLPGVVAYEDEPNHFSFRQTMYHSVGGDYTGAALELQSASPRISFHWPGVVAAQLGIDSAGTICAFNNPGTGYAAFRAGGIYSTGYYYEAGRGIAQGQRYGWAPTIMSHTGVNVGGSIIGYYSIIGYQLWWSFYAVNIVVPAGGSAYMVVTLPPGYPTISHFTDQPIIRGYIPTIMDEPCYCQLDANYINVYRMKAAAWPAGTGHVIGQGFYWIG